MRRRRGSGEQEEGTAAGTAGGGSAAEQIGNTPRERERERERDMTDSPVVSYPKVVMQPPIGETSGSSKAEEGGEETASAPVDAEHQFGVQVTDLSPKATEGNLREFFQFSGKIVDIQLYMPPEGGHAAKIYFEKEEEAETAVLLTGAIILDQQVVIASLFGGEAAPVMGKKAVEVISLMLSQGFVFGKTTLDKLSDFDKRIGLSDSVKANLASAKLKLTKLDEKIQFRSKAKSFFKSVEGKVSEADTRFKISETFTSTSAKVQENKSVKKVTKGMKYGFSTLSANISKISNATTSKVKQQLNKQQSPST